jgi:hypothetical protein
MFWLDKYIFDPEHPHGRGQPEDLQYRTSTGGSHDLSAVRYGQGCHPVLSSAGNVIRPTLISREGERPSAEMFGARSRIESTGARTLTRGTLASVSRPGPSRYRNSGGQMDVSERLRHVYR